jgi:hypothetical protein
MNTTNHSGSGPADYAAFQWQTRTPTGRVPVAGLVELAMAQLEWDGNRSRVVVQVAGPAHEPRVKIPLRFARLRQSGYRNAIRLK